MSRNYRDDLIRLFGVHPRATIETIPEFRQLSDRFAKEPIFQAELNRINFAKNRVESALDADGLTQREMVQCAIRLLLAFQGEKEERGLCHELIVAGYAPRWTEPQRLFFDTAWQTIKLEYDYFLSFTSRRPNGPGDNPVNTYYKHFINAVLGRPAFRNTNRQTTNLLAATIHSVLSSSSVKGFFFPDLQYDNASTEQKLKEACDNCVVFIQLIQMIMFDRPTNGRKNYCHFEWDLIRRRFAGPDDENHVLFVVAAGDRTVFQPYIPYIDYKHWYDHFLQHKDPPYLAETPLYDGKKIEAMRQRLKESLVPKIRAARLSLIDAVP